jgi:hypothetical protein
MRISVILFSIAFVTSFSSNKEAGMSIETFAEYFDKIPVKSALSNYISQNNTSIHKGMPMFISACKKQDQELIESLSL